MYVCRTIKVFIFLQAVLVCSANCPTRIKVSPCTCHNEDGSTVLYCSDGDITLEQLKSALNHFSTEISIEVELEGLNLGTVPSNLFEGLRVKRLDISNCQLDSLNGGKPLKGLDDSLEELIITSSFSEDNEPAKLKLSVGHFKRLRELDMSFNTITELGNDWFQNAPSSLRRLTISNNGIEVIGDRVFANIPNLEYLALDGNRFGPISRSMLPDPANELDVIEFDNNALTSIPEDFFSNMPYLRMVSFATNGIMRLPANTWKSVWSSLDNIDIRGNPLECDVHMDWMSKVSTCAEVYATCLSPRMKSGEIIPFVRSSSCL